MYMKSMHPFYVFRHVAMILFGALFVVAAFYGLRHVYAQDSSAVDARRAQLETELSVLETEINEQRDILDEKQREKVSLERDVAILDAQIRESELSIRARNLSIKQLSAEIAEKEDTIDVLSDRIVREKESLAQLIRKTREIDSFSIVEVVLSNKNLSEFFVDIDSFDAIRQSLRESYTVIEETRKDTSEERDVLEDKQIEETELRTLQELQQERIEDKRGERNNLLTITKGQEATYQEILSTKEKSAASIRAELFTLRGSAAIPFGEALDLANMVGVKTGVRPALILGIITEETNLGENIGNCNLPNDPPEYKWQNIMKPSRDHAPYLDITGRLGLDPELMPLSCAPSYGYGGAMGPAQFIPSTWILYEDRIASFTGHNPPNPWSPDDAFTASAILLMDNGAANSSTTCTLTNDPEKCAALRYFAGWKNANNPRYLFYGNDVMEFTEKYQHQIDILNG